MLCPPILTPSRASKQYLSILGSIEKHTSMTSFWLAAISRCPDHARAMHNTWTKWSIFLALLTFLFCTLPARGKTAVSYGTATILKTRLTSGFACHLLLPSSATPITLLSVITRAKFYNNNRPESWGERDTSIGGKSGGWQGLGSVQGGLAARKKKYYDSKVFCKFKDRGRAV